jgi:hypothetical protein
MRRFSLKEENHAFGYPHPPRHLFRHLSLTYLYLNSCFLLCFVPYVHPIVITIPLSTSPCVKVGTVRWISLKTFRHRRTIKSRSPANYCVISTSFLRSALCDSKHTHELLYRRLIDWLIFWLIEWFIYLSIVYLMKLSSVLNTRCRQL